MINTLGGEIIQVHLVDWLLPTMAGLTVRTCDGDNFYTIFLNESMSSERIQQAYRHELMHIRNQDYDSIFSVQELESIRHMVGE